MDTRGQISREGGLNRNRIKILARILFGVLILCLLFYKIGFDKIAESLSRMNLWALPLAVVFFVLFLVFSSLGSWVLLKPFSRLSFRGFLPCYLPSWAIGLFLPGKLGEASIIYFLKRKKMPIGQGTAFFVTVKTVTILALGIVASTGFFTFFAFRAAVQLLFLLMALIAGFISMLLSGIGKRLIRKILPRKIQETFAGFFLAFSAYFKEHKALLGLSLACKLLAFGSVAVMNYCIFSIGLDVWIPLHKILQISAMETFSALIPISINGLGIRQAAGIYLYGLLGVGAPVVASSQIVGWVLIYLFGSLCLLFRLGPVDAPSQMDL